MNIHSDNIPYMPQPDYEWHVTRHLYRCSLGPYMLEWHCDTLASVWLGNRADCPKNWVLT